MLSWSRQDWLERFSNCGLTPTHARNIVQKIHRHQEMNIEKFGVCSRVRKEIAPHYSLHLPQIETLHVSEDGTTKLGLCLNDGERIESVLIPQGKRTTLCVSSQVGCALQCSFCATGQGGFKRNLRASEIIAQLWLAQQYLKQQARQVTNVVFMGMGEPLLNFGAVKKAIEVMRDDHTYGLGRHKVSVSTVGYVPYIKAIAHETDICLVVSLHAANDELRNQLVPINKKYPLKVLLAACREYLAARPPGEKLLMAYTLIAGVNDQAKHAYELVELLADLPVKVNLIPFNSFPGVPYTSPTNEAVLAFRDILLKHNRVAVVRRPRGSSVAAACGQLLVRQARGQKDAGGSRRDDVGSNLLQSIVE